jgi:hypothetical protein
MTVTIAPVGWLDAHAENEGEWAGPRTASARAEARQLVLRAVRQYGLTCCVDDIRVRWDGTWRMVAYRPGHICC